MLDEETVAGIGMFVCRFDNLINRSTAPALAQALHHLKQSTKTVMFACRSRARTNGATQTFRRPSLGTGLSSQKEISTLNNTSSIPGSGVYVPPHLNAGYQSSFSRNGAAAESRYSKDQLLDLFRAQSKSGQANPNVADFFVDGWNPDIASNASNGGWTKKEEFKDGSGGPEICWDYEGVSHPLGLIEMGDNEKEVWRMAEPVEIASNGVRFLQALSIHL